MKDIFITGATGFLGRACSGYLLRNDDVSGLTILMRDDRLVDFFTKRAEFYGKGVRFVQGDIRKKGLDLSASDARAVRKADEVYHIAADVTLGKQEELEEGNNLFDTNVEGTRNVADLFGNGLGRFYHFSSAFIGGSRGENLPEHWIESKQGNCSYESSKIMAEEVLRKISDQMKVIVLRPGIVTLDENIYTDTPRQTIYSFARMLSRTEQDQQTRLIGNAGARFNAIRMSDFVYLLDKLRISGEREGVYNFVSANDFLTSEALSWISNGLKVSEISAVDSFSGQSLNNSEFLIDQLNHPFKPYLRRNPRSGWDSEKTKILRDVSLRSDDPEWIKDHLTKYCESLR